MQENSIHTAYRRLIRKSQKYILIENQFIISGMEGDQRVKNRIIEEIYQRIVRAHSEQPGKFKVYIFMPLAPSEDSELDKSPVIRACMHWQFQTLSRGSKSLFSMLRASGINPTDYVGIFALRTHDITPSTQVPVSEMVYIHSKVMVVDDTWSIIGSANINDRSMVGNRDSEIAVVMHDTAEYVTIQRSNGTYEKVGKLGYETRTRLLQEHVGILPNELHLYDDLSDDIVFNRIMTVATKNSLIYKNIFGCVPNNDVHSFAELRRYRRTLAKKKQQQKDGVGGMAEEVVEEVVEEVEPVPRNGREIQKQTVIDAHALSVGNFVPPKDSTEQDKTLRQRPSLTSSPSLLASSESKESFTNTASATTNVSKSRSNSHVHSVPDCYAEPPEPYDEVVLNQLNQIRGHIVVYPLEFLKDETGQQLLPHFGEREFLVQSHFFT